MALHLVPEGERDEHEMSEDCPCGPDVVDVAHDGGSRPAVQHRGRGDSAEGVET